MLSPALQFEEMPAEHERSFCLFTPGDSVFLEHCKNSLDFPISIFFRKNSKFWSVRTVFDRKRKNTENGKSTKRNLNFVKWRNGGYTIYTQELCVYALNALQTSYKLSHR